MDGTSRLWEVASGKCIRVVQDPTNAEVLTCCFQPLNNNLFVVSFMQMNVFFLYHQQDGNGTWLSQVYQAVCRVHIKACYYDFQAQ